MRLFGLMLFLMLIPLLSTLLPMDAGKITRFARFSAAGRIGYGILEDETIRELDASYLADGKPTGRTIPLAEVRLLAPCEPGKVIAVGLNYRSHLGTPAGPRAAGIFAKLPTSIIGPEDEILIPAGATDVHYEGELVIIIGKRARGVSVEEAGRCIFRCHPRATTSANASGKRETFNGCAPRAPTPSGRSAPPSSRASITNNLKLETRVNGEVRQSQRTNDLIFDVRRIVSYISQSITLLPGDAILHRDSRHYDRHEARRHRRGRDRRYRSVAQPSGQVVVRWLAHESCARLTARPIEGKENPQWERVTRERGEADLPGHARQDAPAPARRTRGEKSSLIGAHGQPSRRHLSLTSTSVWAALNQVARRESAVKAAIPQAESRQVVDQDSRTALLACHMLGRSRRHEHQGQ